jgi:hypothetical protein
MVENCGTNERSNCTRPRSTFGRIADWTNMRVAVGLLPNTWFGCCCVT